MGNGEDEKCSSILELDIFSKHIFGANQSGDCQSEPKVFLGTYDTGRYQLPTEFQALEETISNFAGSFSRMGAAVIDGASAATELSKIWSNVRICNRNETPVECELRVHRPVIVFINLGTHCMDRDPKYLRRIVDTVIANGAVPIISTKADNREGGHIANEELPRIAYEYKLPL